MKRERNGILGELPVVVCLEPLGADELDDGERLADVSGGDVFVVTVTETSKSNVTPESVYAKKIKTTDHDDNARKKTIMRTFSVPFNIVNE